MESVVREVEGKIPDLKKIFERIVSLHEKAEFLGKDMQDLLTIWGNQVFEKGNPDFELFKDKERRKAEMNKELHEEVARISQLGGRVKDLRRGLVDFYIEHAGEPIYLCWKVGEDRIQYWHPVHGGFAARRPLAELFAAAEA